MYWTAALSTAALLASRALAETISLSIDPSLQAGASSLLQHYAQDPSSHYISRRQTSDDDGDGGDDDADEGEGGAGRNDIVPLTPDGLMDWDTWDNTTVEACLEALGRLTVASNPSGTAICYNLPILNRNSGAFGADLRVFKVSEPSGPWADIPPENIEVTVAFRGAAVSSVEPDQAVQGGAQSNVRRQENAEKPSDMELLQRYFIVGQIHREHMESNMTSAKLEALVMPILTLTATAPDGLTISTNVSSNEAVFLTGVFSDEENLSDFSRADRAVANITAALEDGEVAFVLPGVQILIFPIGLIITGAWTLIGLAAYGFGTYERIKYAENFKRRQALATKATARI